MTTEDLQELLLKVWNREMSADDAWQKIDDERVSPYIISSYEETEYWLPLISTKDVE